jgi:hypothetical protein
MEMTWLTCRRCGWKTPSVPVLELAERFMAAHIVEGHPDRPELIDKFARAVIAGKAPIRTPEMLARAIR